MCTLNVACLVCLIGFIWSDLELDGPARTIHCFMQSARNVSLMSTDMPDASMPSMVPFVYLLCPVVPLSILDKTEAAIGLIIDHVVLHVEGYAHSMKPSWLHDLMLDLMLQALCFILLHSCLVAKSWLQVLLVQLLMNNCANTTVIECDVLDDWLVWSISLLQKAR